MAGAPASAATYELYYSADTHKQAADVTALDKRIALLERAVGQAPQVRASFTLMFVCCEWGSF